MHENDFEVRALAVRIGQILDIDRLSGEFFRICARVSRTVQAKSGRKEEKVREVKGA